MSKEYDKCPNCDTKLIYDSMTGQPQCPECKMFWARTFLSGVARGLEISKRTLVMCDKSAENFKKGIVSDSIKLPGVKEGEICNRDGCVGIMGYEPVENCSCHINPPCSQCVDNPLICLKCGEELGDEE